MDDTVKRKLDSFFLSYKPFIFPAKAILIRPNDELAFIYYLRKGLVRQSFNTEDGQDLTLTVFKTQSYFPMMLVLSNLPNKYFFETMTNVEVRKAPKGAVLTFLKNNPDVLFDLTKRFADGLNGLSQKIENAMYKSAYQRIALILLYLAKRHGEQNSANLANKEIAITLQLSHTDLASWVGLQRETVSRQMEMLKKKNIINYDKKGITIKNFLALEKELDGV